MEAANSLGWLAIIIASVNNYRAIVKVLLDKVKWRLCCLIRAPVLIIMEIKIKRKKNKDLVEKNYLFYFMRVYYLTYYI